MQTRMKWTLVVVAVVFAAACGDSMSSLNPTAPSALSGSLSVEADAADVAAGSMGNGPKPPSGNNGNGNGNRGSGNGNGNGNGQTPSSSVTPSDEKVEIEGLIDAKDNYSITVNNQRAAVTTSTVMRHGDRRLSLGDFNRGDRVHLRAKRVPPTTGGLTLEALEIRFQEAGTGEVEPPPAPTSVVSVMAADADASENGNAPGVFRLTRSGDTSATLTVTFSMGGNATNGTDYPNLQSATFGGGHSTVDVTLTPNTDTFVEGPESATLTLLGGPGYSLGTPQSATVNIADHVVPQGPMVTVVATSPRATEDMSEFGVFEFTRTGSTAAGLLVTFSLGGSADAEDYQDFGTTVTFDPGSATATLLVIANSNADPGAETVVLTVVPGSGYTPGVPASATVTIPQ